MSRYRHIEQRAYERGVEAASGWLCEFLREGGAVTAGGGWNRGDLVFRIETPERQYMTCHIIAPHLLEWQRHFAASTDRRSAIQADATK